LLFILPLIKKGKGHISALITKIVKMEIKATKGPNLSLSILGSLLQPLLSYRGGCFFVGIKKVKIFISSTTRLKNNYKELLLLLHKKE